MGGAPPSDPASAEGTEAADPWLYELYLTDAPANLTALEVQVGSVLVGPGKTPLQVVAPAFDLLSHRGPEQGLLVARGRVPPGERGAVEVAFASVTAVVDGRREPVEPYALVWQAEDPDAEGLLLDIDVERSLSETAKGLRFDPHVKAAYTRAPSTDRAAAADAPRVQGVRGQQGAGAASAAAGAAGAVAGAADVDARVAAVPGLPVDVPGLALPGADGEAPVRDAVREALEDVRSAARVGYIVRFHDGIPQDRTGAAVEAADAVLVHRFDVLPAAYVLATPEAAAALSAMPEVVHVEADVPLTVDDHESRAAVRADVLQHAVTGRRDAQGRPIDGRGVGVAVLDTGIDATHPDLRHASLAPAPAVALNLKRGEPGWVDFAMTDTTSGHGTHVAGIVAGRGTGDQGMAGIAPGATLYGIGIGEAPRLLYAAQGLEWVLENHDQVQPPIRVVQNSWSSTTRYDPASVVNILASRLVDEGVVVVFSAGNLGGDGSSVTTSGYCQNPKPGVLCVAAYDDLNTGTLDGKVAPYSSRGQKGVPSTWPDLSAPGTAVRSAAPAVGLTTGIGLPGSYAQLSGTSMAAPHVSGAVALLLQANPALTPAIVEAVLQRSAHKFADGGAYAASQDPDVDGSHHAKGHGLLDVDAAVRLVLLG